MGPDKYIKNYIEGSLVPAASGTFLENVNPATGKAYAQFPDSGEADLDRAVEAAGRSFPDWAGLEPHRRFRLLMRIADIIEQNLEAFARAESIDTGKPLAMSKSVDIPRAQSYLRYYATAILHLQGASFHQPGEAVHYRMHRPMGIVGCISPWNLPLYLLTAQVAPALAAGNCVIAKTSELTPMTTYMLSKACMEAGLPPGVLNIVHGRAETLEPLMARHPRIQAIAYTGTTSDGKALARQAADSLKKTTLLLGGKNPNIIFADCDFDQMIVGTLRSSFSNNGQINYSCSRIYVQRPLYEKFRAELVKRTQFLKVGDPFSGVTDLGALISREHLEQVLSYLALAEVEGGTILCGGNPMEMQGDLEGGFFLRPAVVEGLPADCRTNQEEIFGPIVTIAPFDTEQEVIELANHTHYGLAASVWTQNISKANRVSEKLRAGTVWINSWMWQDLRPSSEPLKQSGWRSNSGMDALYFFLDSKTVCTRY